MGLLRLMLAVAVFAAHIAIAGESFPLKMLRADQAVQLFFIISGFYMALILNEKYVGPGSYKLFITNRAIRLYPPYWVVASVVLVLCVALRVPDGPLSVAHHVAWPGVVLISAANLLIVGQDAVLYGGVGHAGRLFFAPDFTTTAPQLWTFLLVPPAWSLSLEIAFYAIAPLLVRRRLCVVLTVIAASFALRLFVYWRLDYRNDPWTYRFFPAELGMFLGGTVAYRIYTRLRANPPLVRWQISAGAAFFACVLVTPYLSRFGTVRFWGLYVAAVACIPFLFLLTKSLDTAKTRRIYRCEEFLGGLSYPFYITHWGVIAFLPAALRRAGYGGRLWLPCLAATLLASLVLVYLVSLPLDRLRDRRVAKKVHR